MPARPTIPLLVLVLCAATGCQATALRSPPAVDVESLLDSSAPVDTAEAAVEEVSSTRSSTAPRPRRRPRALLAAVTQ